MFRKYTLIGGEDLKTLDYILGIASFFYIAIGGILTGLLFALLVSFITK